MKLLQSAVQLALKQENPADTAELKTAIAEYEEARSQRLAEMQPEVTEAEIRIELTEGTAYYIEAKVYEMLSGEQKLEEHYLDGIADFEGGRGKYYRSGMAKCLLLDCLEPDWKDGFDFSEGLDELLAEIVS